jgi:peptidoglycan/LPS O-acetylase OafA/YrhL
MSRFAPLLAAAAATGYATIAALAALAALAGMDPDFQYAALAAVACLVAAITLSRVEHGQRRRLAERRAVWARRDREAGHS